MSVWRKAAETPPAARDADVFGYVLVWSAKLGCALMVHHECVRPGSVWCEVPTPPSLLRKS